ncbi:hypothetical protein CR513_61042, partial [Mucuna pruriens]
MSYMFLKTLIVKGLVSGSANMFFVARCSMRVNAIASKKNVIDIQYKNDKIAPTNLQVNALIYNIFLKAKRVLLSISVDLVESNMGNLEAIKLTGIVIIYKLEHCTSTWYFGRRAGANFYVLDMKDELSSKGPTLILGRSFLKTAMTKIDVHAKTLSMEFGDNKVEYTIFEAMKHPTKNHLDLYLDVINLLGDGYMNLPSEFPNFDDFKDCDCTCTELIEFPICVEISNAINVGVGTRVIDISKSSRGCSSANSISIHGAAIAALMFGQFMEVKVVQVFGLVWTIRLKKDCLVKHLLKNPYIVIELGHDTRAFNVRPQKHIIYAFSKNIFLHHVDNVSFMKALGSNCYGSIVHHSFNT